MSTFRKESIGYLTGRGMAEDNAKSVMKSIENEIKGSGLNLDHRVADYPVAVSTVVRITVRLFAKQWLEKNLPNAWFRKMFDSE